MTKCWSGIGLDSSEEPYTVHQDLLCSSSDFFKNACNGRWREAEEGVIRLPEQLPKMFEYYMLWLYFGTLYVKEKRESEETTEATETRALRREYTVLFELYFLGDVMLDNAFKNFVVDAVIDLTIESKCISMMSNSIYNKTLCGDKLRMLLVNMHAWQAKLDTREEDWPAVYWKEVCEVLIRIGDAKFHRTSELDYPWRSNRCQYHTHKDREESCLPLNV